jgi:Icc-related predicted phosphoesterase
MKIWHISDTHGFHDQLTVPTDVDVIIHSGDTTNSRNMVQNSIELWPFVDWFKSLPIKHKVLVAGNHDSAIEGRMIRQEDFLEIGITYLENESCEIEGLKIWGSPITPSFMNWCFMVGRHKIHRVWDTIPDDTDIVVTHGPPFGILDLTENRDRQLEQVGCFNLAKRLLNIKPKLHCFGHVHNHKEIRNSGLLKLASGDTIYSNGAVVADGKPNIINNGNFINLTKTQNV